MIIAIAYCYCYYYYYCYCLGLLLLLLLLLLPISDLEAPLTVFYGHMVVMPHLWADCLIAKVDGIGKVDLP